MDGQTRLPMNMREVRGQQIAAEGRIRKQPDAWIVPSQTQSGYYVVKRDKCTCPDYELHGAGHKCKHIRAVEILIMKETHPDGSTTQVTQIKERRYTQHWHEYNEAATQEEEIFRTLLKHLVEDIPDEPQHRGRPRVPVRDMVYCAIDKVYSTKSCRVTHTRVRDAANRGEIQRGYHYNTSSVLLNEDYAHDLLLGLLHRAALPLAQIDKVAAVDSTGFSTTRFCQYAVERFHERKEHHWLKAHLITGCTTHAIMDVKITNETEDAGDAPHFEPLLTSAKAMGFQFQAVTADKAYSSRQNSDISAELGVESFIPFRNNATGRSRGSIAWRKDFQKFTYEPETFFAGYHKRSNVEATIWANKARFTDTLRSKNYKSQKNELLCKFIAYDLCMLIKAMKLANIYPDWVHLKDPTCIFNQPEKAL